MNFIKVASACPITRVADIDFNVENIKECINIANDKNSKFIVFPELSITSYTCGDLFFQQVLIEKSIDAISLLCNYSKDMDILIAVGAPIMYNYSLYNSAILLFKGKVLGIVPKSYIPNYTEFYEKRWFTSGLGIVDKNIKLYFQKICTVEISIA